MSTGYIYPLVHAEFDRMHANTFPYNEEGNKASVYFTIRNNSYLPFTIYKSGTTYKFDAYPDVVFYPVIYTDTLVIGAATPPTPPSGDDPGDPGKPGERRNIAFMTDYTGVLNITTLSTGTLYTNGVVETTALSISHTKGYEKTDGLMCYFCFSMTDIFENAITHSGITDPGEGSGDDDDPGIGTLEISESDIRDAIDKAINDVVDMYYNPNYNNPNGKLLNNMDLYLDELTGNYFHRTVGWSYHSTSDPNMTPKTMKAMCDDLDALANGPNPPPDEQDINDTGSLMICQVLDWYCHGALKSS